MRIHILQESGSEMKKARRRRKRREFQLDLSNIKSLVVVGMCGFMLTLIVVQNFVHANLQVPVKGEIDVLEKRMQSQDDQEVWQAVTDMGRYCGVEALPPLDMALEDSRSKVREAAARAMGRIEAWDALPSLIYALDDEDVAVRLAANNAVARIIGVDYRFVYKSSKQRRQQIAWFKNNYESEKVGFDNWKSRRGMTN